MTLIGSDAPETEHLRRRLAAFEASHSSFAGLPTIDRPEPEPEPVGAATHGEPTEYGEYLGFEAVG